MKHVILLALLAHPIAWAKVSVSTATQETSLNQNEKDIYNHLTSNKYSKRSKLITMNPMSSHNNEITVPLFDGQVGRFKFEEHPKGVIKGRGEGFDRILIRETNRKYVGHIIFQGNRFVITPVSEGKSVLVEYSDKWGCGVPDEK